MPGITSHMGMYDSNTDPSWMEVTIKWSKCDQFSKGAMSGYLVQCSNNPGPLFVLEDGCLLTRDHFVTALQSAQQTCRIDPSE